MGGSLKTWPVIATVALLWLLALGVAYFSRVAWVIALTVVVFGIVSAILIRAYISARRDAAVLVNLAAGRKPGEDSLAHKLLTEIVNSGAEKKPAAVRAAEVIRQELKLEKFAIFFRENDKFIPRIYSGVNKNDLVAPPVQRLTPALKKDLQNGAVSAAENDSRMAFRQDDTLNLHRPVAFAYSWGRSRAVFAVFEDQHGFFSEVAREPGFNRAFWPAVENHLRLTSRLQEKSQEVRQLDQQLDQSQRQLGELNKELKNKLLDLQSFVKISNDLYSLFDEEQLFSTLKETIKTHLGASSAEIMVHGGEGNFVIRRLPEPDEKSEIAPSLDVESELFSLLAKSPRPVILPLAASGLKQKEPFLSAAFRSGYLVASAIKTGGQIACVLLVGEKNNKAQFSGMDLDFLYIISNIASLSLENIHQYSTIERLSYTDSMTGVYNYRYFYKRLGEEVLRAKRYGRELSLVILDIDNFKSFNDNYGHQAGDLVLKQLSDLITKTVRSIDVLSRYGGEEFCIIMPDTGIDNCQVFIERLRAEIADFGFESELFSRGNKYSVSVGGAVYPLHALMPDRLIYCADMALLKAKSLGRNRAIMYQSKLSIESNSVEGGFNESRQESIL